MVKAEAPGNVTMDMLYQEVKGLKRDIGFGEVFKRYAMEKAMAADASWRRPRFEKEQPEVELAAEVEETSETGKWVSAKVVRWFEEKGYGVINAKGGDVFCSFTRPA